MCCFIRNRYRHREPCRERRHERYDQHLFHQCALCAVRAIGWNARCWWYMDRSRWCCAWPELQPCGGRKRCVHVHRGGHCTLFECRGHRHRHGERCSERRNEQRDHCVFQRCTGLATGLAVGRSIRGRHMDRSRWLGTRCAIRSAGGCTGHLHLHHLGQCALCECVNDHHGNGNRRSERRRQRGSHSLCERRPNGSLRFARRYTPSRWNLDRTGWSSAQRHVRSGG